MAFELPALPWDKGALKPHISEETLDFHYGKHHQAYVTNLNNLVKGTEFENKSLEEIIVSSNGGIFNNAAQIWNHTFYWNSLSPNGGGQPTGKIAGAIDVTYGSFDAFKEKFTDACKTLFGSGWVFLCVDANGDLTIEKEANAGCPLSRDLRPLLTCDVWEHAYYIDYRNVRAQYVKDFTTLINWKFV